MKNNLFSANRQVKSFEKGMNRFWIPILMVIGIGSSLSCFAAPSWSDSNSWSSPSGGTSYGSSSKQKLNVQPFSPGSNNISIDLGQTFLMGDLSSGYNDNIGFRATYTYGVSDIFGFESNIGYSSHSDGKFSMASLLFGLRTNLAWYDKIVPYLSFGLGFYRPSYSFGGTTGSGAQASNAGPQSTVAPVLFGIHLGPGVNLELTKNLFFGTSLTFHDIFGTETFKPNGEKLQAGGTFTSLLIHAGMTF